MYRKILCPVDFSPGSHRALQLAASVARDDSAEIVVAHAWYMPPIAFGGGVAMPRDTMQYVVQDAERGLAEFARELTELGVKRVSTKLVNGVPWTEIVELAKHERCDLVVMGTHGRTALTRVLLGSVTEKVVRHAACSVLTIRPDAELPRLGHVLCPIDFSEASREAAEVAIDLAARHDGRVTLFHVIEIPTTIQGEPISMVGDLTTSAVNALDGWADELRRKATIPVLAQTEIGRAGSTLLGVIEKDPTVSLVVVGSHGRTGIKRALLGSVAEKIVRHATCPVLVSR